MERVIWSGWSCFVCRFWLMWDMIVGDKLCHSSLRYVWPCIVAWLELSITSISRFRDKRKCCLPVDEYLQREHTASFFAVTLPTPMNNARDSRPELKCCLLAICLILALCLDSLVHNDQLSRELKLWCSGARVEMLRRKTSFPCMSARSHARWRSNQISHYPVRNSP